MTKVRPDDHPSPPDTLAIALGSYWLAFAWFGYLLSVIGVVHAWSIGVAGILALFVTRLPMVLSKWFQFQENTSQCPEIPQKLQNERPWGLPGDMRSLALLSIISFFVILIELPSLTAPTIFAGRDQGSYSLAALHIAETGQVEYSSTASQAFFTIYGPGKALNFPGFAYNATGALVPQFPLGSITWFASFVTIFGLNGFFIANCITLILALFFFHALLRIFLPARVSLIGLAIAATSFPFIWFARYTLSENLAWALVVFLVYQLTLFIKKPALPSYFLVLASTFFLAFTRIEGWAILFIVVPLTLLSPSGRTFREHHSSWSIPILLGSAFSLLDIWINLPFFRSLGGTLWHQWQAGSTIAGAGSDSPIQLWDILWLYGLAPIFIIGLVSGIILWKHGHRLELVPLLVISPTLIYLVDAHISGDHPWLLRRFAWSLWPVLLMVLAYMSAFGSLWLVRIRGEVWRRRAEAAALRTARA